ncbi:MAG: PAS domain S-box protein [Ignavibacteriae bacterium]|nr:PAS domain S-box protein [Ignavibacteriota bacterium]
MNENSEIENYFDHLQYSWGNFVEVLPIGMLVFDKKWRIKSVNKNFFDFVCLNREAKNLINNYLLDDECFNKSLPLVEILQLSKGKYFETNIENKNFGNNKVELSIKGSPIFKDGEFEGGVLIAEDFKAGSNSSENDLFSFSTFENFVKNICDCFLIIDNEGIVKYASPVDKSKCAFLDKSEGKSISTVFNNSQTEELTTIVENVNSENTSQNIKLNYYSSVAKITLNSVFIPLTSGDEKTSNIIILLKETNGKGIDCLGFLNNANELNEFQSIASSSSDAVFKISMHGNVTFWTDEATKFFDVQEGDIKDKFLGKLFSEIDEVYLEKIRNELILSQSWDGKFKYKNAQKSFWTNIKIVLTAEKNNLIIYCNYISESKQRLEEAKQEEIQFFKETVLKSNEMILQVDSHGTISFVNEKFCEKFGYQSDEISGVTFTELIDNKFKIENKIPNLFSVIRDEKFDVIPLISKTDNIVNVCPEFNITHDGTSLKYYTVYLRECKKERKIISLIAESLLVDSKEATVILLDDKIARANPKFIELFRYEKEEDLIDNSIYSLFENIKKKNIDDILYADVGSNIFNCRNKLNKKIEIEIKKINKTSKEKYSVLLFKPINQEVTLPVEKNNFSDNLENNLKDFLWSAKIIDNELNVEFISSGINKVAGYSQMEFISQPTFWHKIIHPDDQNFVRENFSELLSDKNKFSGEFNYRLIKKDGSTTWISNKIKIVRDAKGVAVKVYGSASDVTIRAQENIKLKSEIHELQTKNETKDKFISIISHDLRSPFTSILGFTELIATDTTLTKEEIIEYVSNIRDASQNTLNLVNSLLDWTRLQTGRIEITPKVVNANYLVKKTLVTLSGSAYQKGLTLTSKVDDSLYINADENILTQVFNNLVSNSIKFTPKGGSINIEAKKIEAKQKIQFVVSDTGVGVDPKDIPKLFLVDKKFTTLGTDGEKGTGLGLSLVKEIIEKHNGEISVKSEVGKGTEFNFTIPISIPSILLIDNVEAERNLYSKLIESITEGIKIYTASNVSMAREIIEEKMPMLIIIEHQLGETNGLKFIEEISSSELKYKPPFSLLSRDIENTSIEEYKILGVEEIFTKPVDLKKFKLVLDKAIIKN